MRLARAEIGDVRALVVRGDLEGRTGPGGRLFKDQRDVAPRQPTMPLAQVLLGAQLPAQVDQVAELLGGEVDLLEQVASVQVHAGSLSIGQVMQRGPPRPRPSSLPTMVTTSMPYLRSIVLVATLRS